MILSSVEIVDLGAVGAASWMKREMKEKGQSISRDFRVDGKKWMSGRVDIRRNELLLPYSTLPLRQK